MERKLNINHIRVIKQFSHLAPVKIGEIEQYLTTFVSLPTAKKTMAQMIDMGLIQLIRTKQDKRVRLVKFLVTEINDLF